VFEGRVAGAETREAPASETISQKASFVAARGPRGGEKPHRSGWSPRRAPGLVYHKAPKAQGCRQRQSEGQGRRNAVERRRGLSRRGQVTAERLKARRSNVLCAEVSPGPEGLALASGPSGHEPELRLRGVLWERSQGRVGGSGGRGALQRGRRPGEQRPLFRGNSGGGERIREGSKAAK
jgi:hypothetical protein